MTSRSKVAAKAHSYIGTARNGYYDGPNPFSRDLGHPTEAWCADFVTDVYKRCGLDLPPMQHGCSTGFAYVPSGWEAAGPFKAQRSSWLAEPADLAVFDWNGDGLLDHVEMVMSYEGGVLTTVGGNSGPDGGVNLHTWAAPKDRGNPLVHGVIDTSKLVSFTHNYPPSPSKIHHGHRLLLLKSPYLHGADVRKVQRVLVKAGLLHAVSGVYLPATANAVEAYQHEHHLVVDGVVGRHTAKAMHLGPRFWQSR